MVRPSIFCQSPVDVNPTRCTDSLQLKNCDNDETLDFEDIIIKQMNAKKGVPMPPIKEHVFKTPLSTVHIEKVKDLSFLNGDIINMAIKSFIKPDDNKSKNMEPVFRRPKTETVIKRVCSTNRIKRKIKCDSFVDKHYKRNHNEGKNVALSMDNKIKTFTKAYKERTFSLQPLIKSENHESIDLNVNILSQDKFRKLYETPSTPYIDQYIIIYDVQMNEVDIYELNSDSLITEHYTFNTYIQHVNGTYYSLKDPEINEIIESKIKVEVYSCCWCIRERFINTLVPKHPGETIKFMRKPHKCETDCKCCCAVKTILHIPSIKSNKDLKT